MSAAYFMEDGRVYQRQCGCCNRRPVVVIDLSEEPVEGDRPGRNEAQLLVSMLRETAENFFTPDAAALALKVAEQIEAQTADPKPPKPVEPTGLGAVVEDAAGYTYVRGYPRMDDAATHPWHVIDYCANKGAGWWKWDQMDVVRVLSEGVTP